MIIHDSSGDTIEDGDFFWFAEKGASGSITTVVGHRVGGTLYFSDDEQQPVTWWSNPTDASKATLFSEVKP